jgi:ligand-binding sensor protein
VIGADNYGKILQAGLLEFKESLIAQDSHLGWIISGPILARQEVKVTCVATIQNSNTFFGEKAQTNL